jgi:hypothetical protein
MMITTFVFLVAAAAIAHEKGFEVEIPQAKVPPLIDGVADDAIWQFAPEVLVDNINTGGKVKDDQISTAKAAYDAENVYVLFINFVTDTKKIQTVSPGHDQNVWMDEENEIFIDVEHDAAHPYYHIMINAKNVTQDDHNGAAEGAWEPKLESKTKVNDADKNWVLEVKIPFSDLGVKKTPLGETWGWNFNRHIVPPDIWTGWATTGASFHTPTRFGDLIFGAESFAVNPKDKAATIWAALKTDRAQ